MNAKQSNKMASFTATAAVLKAAPEVASVPGLPAKVATLSARMGEINRLATTQTQPIQLSTMERDLLFGTMTDSTLEIAGLIRTVAREQNLPLLAQAVQLGRGSFSRVRRSHRVWFAQRVLDAAQTVRLELEAHGVTAETLTALEAAIEAARGGVNRPRESVAVKKSATEQLAGLFAEVDALLDDEIDPMVFPLRKIHPGFHATYRAARIVVDLPGSQETTAPETPAPAVPLVAVQSEKQAA